MGEKQYLQYFVLVLQYLNLLQIQLKYRQHENVVKQYE